MRREEGEPSAHTTRRLSADPPRTTRNEQFRSSASLRGTFMGAKRPSAPRRGAAITTRSCPRSSTSRFSSSIRLPKRSAKKTGSPLVRSAAKRWPCGRSRSRMLAGGRIRPASTSRSAARSRTRIPSGSRSRSSAGMSQPMGGRLSVAWVPERTVTTPSSAWSLSASTAAVFRAATEADLPSNTASIFKACPP